MYREVLLYSDIGIFLNSTISRWSANKKSMIDLQKSNNASYQNVEQEWMKLLIKQYNLHETNYCPYQMYYIYS